ncbi:hypothetical protein [Brachybacterium sp. UNK5269]|uniref:hypothetical protein n=1 Tax=Brachybacterium sp. UNK5269 TaxID=3408576 RepID=UPI003BB078A3
MLAEPEQGRGWPSSVEVCCGSVTAPGQHTEVFTGARTLFLAGAVPGTVPTVLQLAERAGVLRVVLLSSHGPEYEEAYPPETWFWTAIERAVQASSIPATIIRPSAVMGSMLEGTYPATGSGWPAMIRSDDTIREPFADTGHYPFIHEEDLASVAAAALRADTFTGTVLEAVGPPVSTRSRVDGIAAAIGRRLTLVDVSVDEARALWRDQGWPEGAIDVTLYALEEYGARTAELTRWTSAQRPTVAEIIGRRPRTYDDWAQEHAHLLC